MSDALESRTGLPEALRYLVAEYPRDIWQGHGHFDGLTRFWLSRHLEFRRATAILREQARLGLDAQQDLELTHRHLLQVGRFLTESLHVHHHIEDTEYFPLFTRTEPGLANGFTLLDADHDALHLHIDTMDRRLAALAGPDGLGRLLDHVDAFDTFLDRHLTDEEDLIVPIILKHGPVHA